ncbi:unnamed protein product, partial [Mesorhabditis spiculigera]
MRLSAVILLATISLASATTCPSVPNADFTQVSGPAVDGMCPIGFVCISHPRDGNVCYSDRSIGPCVGNQCPTPYTCVVLNGMNNCYDLSGGNSCIDKDPNCPLYLKNGYCRSKLYTAAEKKASCCATCAFNTACQDADPNCPLYEKNSKYCNSTTSTELQKVNFCRKTCGVC